MSKPTSAPCDKLIEIDEMLFTSGAIAVELYKEKFDQAVKILAEIPDGGITADPKLNSWMLLSHLDERMIPLGEFSVKLEGDEEEKQTRRTRDLMKLTIQKLSPAIREKLALNATVFECDTLLEYLDEAKKEAPSSHTATSTAEAIKTDHYKIGKG